MFNYKKLKMLKKLKIIYMLVGIALVLASCGTSGRTYNIGTGELLPNSKTKY